MPRENNKKSFLKRIFLYFLEVFFYYGSHLFISFGFIVLFVFIIGRTDEDFVVHLAEKKWWLISALSLLIAGFVIRRRTRFWRNEQLKYKVRRMFRQARKNDGKK